MIRGLFSVFVLTNLQLFHVGCNNKNTTRTSCLLHKKNTCTRLQSCQTFTPQPLIFTFTEHAVCKRFHVISFFFLPLNVHSCLQALAFVQVAASASLGFLGSLTLISPDWSFSSQRSVSLVILSRRKKTQVAPFHFHLHPFQHFTSFRLTLNRPRSLCSMIWSAKLHVQLPPAHSLHIQRLFLAQEFGSQSSNQSHLAASGFRILLN